VIHCPLLFDAPVSTRQEIRRQNATPEDALVIINVGRMEPYKGQHVLIDALARLDQGTPWTCWIVGGAQRPAEEAYERSLRQAVDARGLRDRVMFLGQRRDVPSLLAAADLCCHPNQGAEPFGLSIVEALHAGLPVIATALGGPSEIVTESCGRLVPPGDSVALADALTLLIRNREARHRMTAAGPARADGLCNAVARLDDLGQALERLRSRVAA
jgi:glycosyltransferase involved in cell wall biosynthesis